MRVRRVAAGLLALMRNRGLDRELESEIIAHLELAEREALAAGLTPEEARRAARKRFGGVEQMKEAHRDQRSVRWIETLLHDFRHGLALLARAPAFASVAIGVLALGIGANTAMFSVMDAVLLKPLPFPNPERIVRVWEAPAPSSHNGTNTLDFLDWKRLNTVFESLSAERAATITLTGDGEPARFPGKFVSADYFEVFGVHARIGRTFTAGEDEPGAEPVVLLSHAVWQTHFGGDPGVLNRRLVVDGEPRRVIGVLPTGAFDRDDKAGFWMPLTFTPEQRTRGYHWLLVYGRLRSGVTLEQAQQQMVAIDARLTELSPEWKRDWSVLVERFDKRLVDDRLRQSVSVVFGAVVMVLLIACANVANLLLVRGAARKKEMAIRAALGASRGRLVAQLLTESLALCILGGAGGIAVAHLLLGVTTPLLSKSLPFTADVGLDLRVLTFAGAVAVAVSLLVGLLPSLQTSFGKLAQAMNQASRGSSGSGAAVRRIIVAGEVAASFVLICGALLLFKSLLKLQSIETGVRMENVITMSSDLPLGPYQTPERATAFFRAVTERLRVAPGVVEAAVSTDLPLQEVGEGQVMLTMAYDKSLNVRLKRVSPEYFATLGIPVVSGRALNAMDHASSPRIAVVNEELAARMADVLGLADPLGQSVRVSTPEYVKKDGALLHTQIVGVIRSERVGIPGAADVPVAYVPIAQVPAREVKLIVRTARDPFAVMPAIRQAVKETDPSLAVGDVRTLQEVHQRGLSSVSEPAWLIGAFAVVAAFLAALGLYGVLSHTVAQQEREIGIRLALGAARHDVVSHVLRSAISMALLGLALGLGGAAALTRVLQTLLFEVSPLDPPALAAACLSITVVGLLAASLPALRALRVDPITILRE
jgi:putative ABC transport system permease protein